MSGSYAEFTQVPRANVVAVKTELLWEELAAIPESYATAWTALYGNVALTAGQTMMVRGATSALGQAAVNIAAYAGAYVIATTRNPDRSSLLESLGAREVLLESQTLSKDVHERHPRGIDAVHDIIGNTTVLDSLATLRRDGRVCLVGVLGGGGPLTLEPVFQMPSGTHLSVFASALVTGICAVADSFPNDRRSRC